jgi:hypothetical protein
MSAELLVSVGEYCRRPYNVSLQLTGDWCAEVVVAAALVQIMSSLHLPSGYVARS